MAIFFFEESWIQNTEGYAGINMIVCAAMLAVSYKGMNTFVHKDWLCYFNTKDIWH